MSLQTVTCNPVTPHSMVLTSQVSASGLHSQGLHIFEPTMERPEITVCMEAAR